MSGAAGRGATTRRLRRSVVGTLTGPLRRLTTRGRAVLSAGVTAAGCALLLGQRDLLRVGVLLAVVPLLAVLVLGRSRYRLSCSRQLEPVRVQVGVASRVVLEVANVSSSRCGLVLAEEQLPYVLGSRPRFVLPGLEPGERRAVSYPVRSDVRGRFPIGPLTLTMTDPFGMGEHRRAFSVRDELVVVPAIVPLPAIGLAGDWNGSGDTRPRAFAAAGEDDVTTREYRHGDDLRRVHWRSTARRGELMVRREEQPWQSRATLLLDRRRSAHRGDGATSTFEWAVSAVASLAVHLTGRGYALRMVDGSSTDGTRELRSDEHPGTATTDAADAVLDVLAAAAPGGSVDLSRAVAAAGHGMAGGLLVAVLGRLRAGDSSLLSGVHQPGIHCLALVAPGLRGATAGSTAGSPGGSPAGSPAGSPDEHEVELDRLRAAGWEVVVAEAGERLDATWGRLGLHRQLVRGTRQGVVGGARR
jgi:uncharacterized protein (DUF58 family)